MNNQTGSKASLEEQKELRLLSFTIAIKELTKQKRFQSTLLAGDMNTIDEWLGVVPQEKYLLCWWFLTSAVFSLQIMEISFRWMRLLFWVHGFVCTSDASYTGNIKRCINGWIWNGNLRD